LEDADVLLAGIAVANDAVLVTRNLKHFSRTEGLKLESWEV
jgi:tRNA(fMet)-specific endonuclease VapC